MTVTWQLPVLPRVPEYCRATPTEQTALLGEAGVVEDQHAVPFAGELEHRLDALAVEVLLVPVDAGHEPLESLLGGAGDDLGEGIAVLVGVLGEQSGEVAFQGLAALAPPEMDAERFRNSASSGSGSRGACGMRMVFFIHHYTPE